VPTLHFLLPVEIIAQSISGYCFSHVTVSGAEGGGN